MLAPSAYQGRERRALRLSARLAALLICAAAALPASSAAAPVSSHSQISTCCMPHAEKERVFQESRALGATYIRVGVEVSGIFPAPPGPPDWRNVDDVMALSRRYGLPVLGIILRTPTWLSRCPTGPDPSDCPPTNLDTFGSLTGQIAAHARGTIHHWQILNEPSLSWTFVGTPEDYGRMLSAASDAIKRAAPEDKVVTGNLYVNASDEKWARRAFATAGAGRKFDIASINLRSGIADITGSVHTWRHFLDGQGFRGPIWVAEHGYPADPQFQYLPEFQGGDVAQAHYLQRSLPALDAAGVAEVFVTVRHTNQDRWTAEGFIDFGGPPAYTASRRPAFYVVRAWVDEWHRKQADYRRRVSRHRADADRQRAVATASDSRAGFLRRRARTARRRARRYLRRARKLRAAARRYELCFERTGDPVCAQDAARTTGSAKLARRRAKKAAAARRRSLHQATLCSRRAEKYRHGALLSSLQAFVYAGLIKPLR